MQQEPKLWQLSMNKIVGTLAPLSALNSISLGEVSTFEVGRKFIKWLAANKQGAWQLLPIQETQLEPESATIHVTSPYKSYGVGLDPKFISNKYRDYQPTKEELRQFVSENSDWLEDYTLFSALRDYYRTDDWSKWGKEIRERESKALDEMKVKLAEEINEYVKVQRRAAKDFTELKTQARENKIVLLGDFPFYISYASPLVWAHQELFELNSEKKMEFVSGLPDGPKAHFGRQVWNHPLYKWAGQESRVMNLWKLRIKYFCKLFDLVRLDHAKGLFQYGSMSLINAAMDSVKDGPGEAVLTQLLDYAKELGLSVFAEDSGDRLEKLREVLKHKKIPGIRVLRFALTIKDEKERLHPSYAETKDYPENCIAYTTTHDTETLMGYLKLLTVEQKGKLASFADVPYSEEDKILATNLRTAVVNSPAMISIIPIQDWLLTEERINVPGTETPTNDHNWRYKVETPIENLKIYSKSL